MFAKGPLEVVDELLHLLFGVGGEVLFHVELTYSLTEQCVGNIQRVFPAGHFHLLARHGTTIHVEVGIGKRIAQIGRSGVNILEDQVLSHILNLEALHHLVDFGQGFRLEHAHLVYAMDIECLEILGPIDIGVISLELVE